MKKKRFLFMIASIIAIMLFSVGYYLTGSDPADNGDNGDSGDTVFDIGDSGDTVFDIGDTGPAGGLIFYIDTADEHTWTYLEVAPSSTEWTSKEWGDYRTQIGGDAALTGIGEGQAATTAIVSHMEGKSITDTAAQLCDALSHNGFEDWFLPSRDELNAIWDNIVDNGSGSNSGVGGFAGEYYWSSSEASSNDAWTQNFNNGNQYHLNCNKYLDERVRAVRAF